MSHVPWLVQVAKAALTWEDLVLRGVCGLLQVEGVSEIRKMHAHVIATGWERDLKSEREESFSAKIEYRVYMKEFEHGKRWITMTAGVCMGAFCDIEVKKTPGLF